MPNVNEVNQQHAADITEQKKGSGSIQLPGGWTKHAPSGGITINGKFFSGGRFIPNTDVDKASPEEIAELQKKLLISKAYGPEAVKGMEKKEAEEKEATKKTEEMRHPKINVNETVYIIDDGSLLGIKSAFGGLILKWNNKPLIPAEIELLNFLHTQQLDLIDSQQVISIKSPGHWPEVDKIEEELEVQKIPIKDYTLLNNLSDPLKDLFTSPLPKKELLRLSKRGKDWLVEGNKILRLCSCPKEKADNLLTKKLYSLTGTPSISASSCDEGILTDDIEGKDEGGDEYDKLPHILKHTLIDALTNTDPKTIIIIKKQPIHTHFNTNYTDLPEMKSEQASLLTENELNEQKSRLSTLTPALLDRVLEQVQYPIADREQVKQIILERVKHLNAL